MATPPLTVFASSICCGIRSGTSRGRNARLWRPRLSRSTRRRRRSNRSLFPNDEAVFKILYLALKKIEKKWTMPIRDWTRAMQQFAIVFEGRMPLP